MDKLCRTIEAIRAKLGDLRKRSLKETPTRTIIVDPLLEAMGWDVRDPDEVQLEYPTVDGKSVDYALLLNRKPTLLVEAKPLDDPLNDVKGITQVVGYAANDGIVWCVLTNGVVWKVYRSVEQCPAPDKLMFEISLDPHESEAMSVQQVARQLWRLSREEMAKGTLDAIGEQTFTDGKVRKALDGLMRDAPRALVKLVRATAGDGELSPQSIKQSLARLWPGSPGPSTSEPVELSAGATMAGPGARRSAAADKAWGTRRAKVTRSFTPYDESHHTKGQPLEVAELYRGLDRFCLSLQGGGVERRCTAMTVNYLSDKRIFCSVRLLRSGLRVWLKLEYRQLSSPPGFARDVSSVGHHGVGDVELAISNLSQLDEAFPVIKASWESQQRG
jgi:predicted transport protein